jgi:phosphohistidine phosphatase SixA
VARRIYLVAEADAGDRESWPGPDRFRPITRDGWKQARELAARLRDQRVSRAIASPWLRCRQTLMPLADELGIDVDEHRALAEAEPVERVLTLLAQMPDTTTVVCTHADLVREILNRRGVSHEPGEIGPWVLEGVS